MQRLAVMGDVCESWCWGLLNLHLLDGVYSETLTCPAHVSGLQLLPARRLLAMSISEDSMRGSSAKRGVVVCSGLIADKRSQFVHVKHR